MNKSLRFGWGFLLAVTGIIVIVMASILLLQVFGRYVLLYPFSWPEELAGFLFVWLIFLGAPLAHRGGKLIGIPFITERLPGRWAGLMRLLSKLLVVTVLFALIFKGVESTIESIGMRTTVLGFSWAYINAALPVGFSLLVLCFLSTIVSDIRAMVAPSDSGE